MTEKLTQENKKVKNPENLKIDQNGLSYLNALKEGIVNDKTIHLYEHESPESAEKLRNVSVWNDVLPTESLKKKKAIIESKAEEIIDIPDRQEKQIKELDGDIAIVEEKLKPEFNMLAKIREGVSGKFAKLAAMVSMIGILNTAKAEDNKSGNINQEAKKETNVVYVDNKNDPKLKAYNDSLELYNNSLSDSKAKYSIINSRIEKYNKDKKFYQPSAVLDEQYRAKETIDPSTYEEYIKNDIEPIGVKYLFSGMSKNPLNLARGFKGYVNGNAIRIDGKIAEETPIYKKPVLEVKLKEKTPEIAKKTTITSKKETKPTVELKKNANDVTKDSIRTKIKTETIKTNKVEIKKDNIIYVEDENDPKLKAYQDSLILSDLSQEQLKFAEKRKQYTQKYEKLSKQDQINGTNEADKFWKKIVKDYKFADDEVIRLSMKTMELSQKTENYPVGEKKMVDFPSYGKDGTSRHSVYKKPEVEVKLKPKVPTVNKKIEIVKQKETIKNPEKTGYTVRVGEKLYYLSKEDLNKLESDKTTHYNVNEKGDGTEKHLVWWGGNEQGQNLQQVAERLGIKLPRAFDTQEQKFDQ